MASGMPSSARQILATSPALASSTGNQGAPLPPGRPAAGPRRSPRPRCSPRRREGAVRQAPGPARRGDRARAAPAAAAPATAIPRDAQRFPAGRQHPDVGAGRQNLVGKRGGAPHDVSSIEFGRSGRVSAATSRSPDPRRSQLTGPGMTDHRALPDAERAEHGEGTSPGSVTGVSSTNHTWPPGPRLPRPVVLVRAADSRDSRAAISGASRVLPAPPGPVKRDQPALVQHLHHPRDILVPADEAGQRLADAQAGPGAACPAGREFRHRSIIRRSGGPCRRRAWCGLGQVLPSTPR